MFMGALYFPNASIASAWLRQHNPILRNALAYQSLFDPVRVALRASRL